MTSQQKPTKTQNIERGRIVREEATEYYTYTPEHTVVVGDPDTSYSAWRESLPALDNPPPAVGRSWKRQILVLNAKKRYFVYQTLLFGNPQGTTRTTKRG